MKELKIIITVSICLIAVFSSFMWVYSKTLQRSTDDLVKIHAGSEEFYCIKAGGIWNDVLGNNDCTKHN